MTRGAQSGAAQLRKRETRVHRAVRFAVQVVFFIFAPGVFSAAFNGVKYLMAQIGAGAPIEATSFLVLLVATLAFTVLFGRFFCGYACAFGILGDVLYAASGFVLSKMHLARVVFPDPLVKALSLLKYVLLVAICAASVLGMWAAVSGYSPWVAFAGFTSGSSGSVDAVAIVLLVLVAVGMIVRERFFCQFLCPMGAVFALVPVLGFSEFTRMRGYCARSCGCCREACPVDIWPDGDAIGHGECIACGRCADACPMNNVNLVAIEREKGERDKASDEPRPLRKTKEEWLLVRGTGIPLVLVKAAMLLALFWALGATRYLPELVFPPLVGG